MLDSANYSRLVKKVIDCEQQSIINSPINMGVSTAMLLLARQYASTYREGGETKYGFHTYNVYAMYANRFRSLRARDLEDLLKDKIAEKKGVTITVNFPLINIEHPISGVFTREFVRLINKFFFYKEEETKELAYSPTNFGGIDDYSSYTMNPCLDEIRKIEERNLKPVYDGKVGGISIRKEDIVYKTFFKYCLKDNIRMLKVNFINTGWIDYKSGIQSKSHLEWIRGTIIKKFPKSIRENIKFLYGGKDMFPHFRKEEIGEVYLEDTLDYLYRVLDIPTDGILESLRAYGITPNDNPKLQFLKLQFRIFGEELFPEYTSNREELIEALSACGSTHYAELASSIPEMDTEAFYEETSEEYEDDDETAEEEEGELVW